MTFARANSSTGNRKPPQSNQHQYNTMSEKPFTGTVGQMKTASKFLASEDFIGLGEVELTISGVYENADEVMQDGKKKNFHSIGFNGKPKRLVLNATNRKTLAAAFGSLAPDWIGKKVKIHVIDGVRNPAGGETVMGMRLKATPDPALLRARREQMTAPTPTTEEQP